MEHFFDISHNRTITSTGVNYYKTPLMHPNRTLSEHDFIYMLEGTWKIGQNDEKFVLAPGDVLILEAGHPHYGIENCAAGTSTMYFHTEKLLGDKESEGSIKLCSLIKAKSNPLIKLCFEKIIFSKNQGDLLQTSIYFNTLLCELSSCTKNVNNIADRIRHFITFADGIPSNEDIAREFNISLKTAEQTFKKAFGTTIHQYLLETKIETAKYYLTDFPNMRICEISNSLGFYDEFHFSRQFKKITGVSPREFKSRKTKEDDICID